MTSMSTRGVPLAVQGGRGRMPGGPRVAVSAEGGQRERSPQGGWPRTAVSSAALVLLACGARRLAVVSRTGCVDALRHGRVIGIDGVWRREGIHGHRPVGRVGLSIVLQSYARPET